MDKLISVIVPVYKVEPYLEKCVNSIRNQTYKTLEIILIDDGSPDHCPEICDKYAREDNRIKVIHQINRGLSAARNAGLNIATGDYVGFVDSDDWLEPRMFEYLLSCSIEHDSDITECGFSSFVDNKVAVKCSSEERTTMTFYSFGSIVKQIVSRNVCPRLAFEVWNKLFKRSIIGDVRFKEGQIYEDLFFDRMVFKRCNKLVYIDAPLYNYRVNRDGSTATFFHERKLCKFSELDDYIKDLELMGEKGIADDLRVFACGSAIDMYQMALKYGGSQYARTTIHTYFKKYLNNLSKTPLSYFVFSISPILYARLRTVLSWFLRCKR